MSGHPGYKLLLDEMWDLHCRKAKSYGSEEDSLANLRSGERFGVPAWKRCLVEAESAFYRTVNYCNGRNPSNENLENALMDAAAFSMLALLFVREEREKREAGHMERLGWTRTEAGDWIIIDDPEAKHSTATAIADNFNAGWDGTASRSDPPGYRPPSEEVGKRMTETLERAK